MRLTARDRLWLEIVRREYSESRKNWDTIKRELEEGGFPPGVVVEAAKLFRTRRVKKIKASAAHA